MNIHRNRNYTALTLIAGVLGAGLVGSLAQAQVASPAEPKKSVWETTAAAGLTLTRGNSDTLLTTVSLDTQRKWPSDEILAGIAGGYGKSDGVKNTEFIKGYAQYNRLFNERLYGGIRLDASYDGIANLDYRLSLSPLLGYYLIKEAKTTLAVEAGPSLVLEKYKGQSSESYLGARFGERFEHQLTDTTRIWQSLGYVPRVDRWAEKYLLTAEVGIEAAITKQWSLRVVGQDIYDSQPLAGNKKNDLRLIAGTAYKF
jgi:putative salt-induced outer membrane protein YdiY